MLQTKGKETIEHVYSVFIWGGVCAALRCTHAGRGAVEHGSFGAGCVLYCTDTTNSSCTVWLRTAHQDMGLTRSAVVKLDHPKQASVSAT